VDGVSWNQRISGIVLTIASGTLLVLTWTEDVRVWRVSLTLLAWIVMVASFMFVAVARHRAG
jgi:hypothetical protein